MNLESVFYVIGIIYMSATLVIYIAIAVAVFALKKKVDQVSESVEEKIHFVQRLASDPARTAIMVGSSVAGKALKNASRFLRH